MEAMAKPGPKPRPPEEVRSEIVSLRTTPPSKKGWIKAAGESKQSLNDWAIRILDRAAKNLKKK